MVLAKRKIPSAKLRSAAFRRVRADHTSELAADYVELIADLIDEKGEARGSDIALRLGVANATVVKTLKRLQDIELVTQEPYRAIFLTGEGMALADDSRRKHKIVEAMLLALGVPPETARIDAEGMEHHVSPDTLRAMVRFLARGRST